MSQTLEMYKASGNEAFTQLATEFAPYFSTIDPMFVDLRPGYAEVNVPNQKKIHNHLGTVHAIAMCNAAELVAGMMTDVSIPDTSRWIPTGMTVKYLAKAKTDLRAIAKGDSIDWNSTGNIDVPVVIYDADGKEVFTAAITMNVSNKK
ncbi:hotdog fold domain-containing protein [Desulforegula conservatrix]|uniref:hotdog fold domain-containing protein n=1 Tax=Desulforegula conservatrix TaxID=153026 RepID=UPI0003FC8657|nr:hotdog fold domain-containing protein [Desulforegula conservatrix]